MRRRAYRRIIAYSCITSPHIATVDLVKNVYQKDASVAGQQRYSSLRHCVRSIYRRNGMGGFYNGLWATMYRAFPIHAINLLVYEYFLTLLSEGGLTAVAGEL